MFYSEKDDREKRLRFSIRKVSFGAASVAVAALYLFMGSGAVSAEEAQAVQSNEEVAADKDSETEKKSEEQQPTYAAPAAKEQGSATNTEAGDEGKQESHPGTKEEEANSSERSETTTKTRSDENSVSGDSSSPKSEGEGTRLEEASSKPKVRKRREADPAPPATAADADSDANQTYTAPGDDASVEDLATKLKDLPETVENEKKLANIDQVGATKNINQGEVSELNEFGGWKAINGGKFGVARKTDNGVFPIETVNTVRTNNGGKDQTWLNESSFDRSNDYALFLGLVRTEATKTEKVDDGSSYTQGMDYNNKGKGLKNYQGIEKTFKNYSLNTGSDVTVSFYTGITGDIDGNKAGYKVEVITKTAEGTESTIYSQSFYPQTSSDDEKKKVTALALGSNAHLDTDRSTMESQKDMLTVKLGEESNKKKLGTSHGTFTSKNISLLPGVTDYTVRISAADNTKLGMGFQVPWRQYALPVVGTGFSVTQDTRKVAKDLSEKVYNKLTESKAEDTKWSTPETKAAYEAKLQEIKEKIDSGASTSDYQTVVGEAVEQWKKLDEGQKIKDKAKKAIADKLKEKEAEIDKNDKLSPAEKDKAKDAAKKAAEDAKQAITNANSQDEVTNKQTEGTKAIGDVNPIGTENAVNAIAEAAAVKMAEIEDDETLSEDEKNAAKEEVAEAVRKAGEAIRKAKETKNQDGVEQAKTEVISEVTAINPVGKDKAIKAIEDKLKEKEKAIDNNSKLSPREKAEAKQQAKAAADKAKQAITDAQTQDDVNMKEAEGTAAIGNVNPVGKDKAKEAVDAKLKEKEEEIDNNNKLSPREKEAAKQQAQAAADKAKQAITNANSQDEVTEKETEGTTAIGDVNPIGTDMAVDAIAEAAARKMAEIDDNDELSEDEKNAEKAKVEEAVTKAAQAIKKAKDANDQGGVDKAQEDALSEVTAVKPVAKDKAKADLEKAAQAEKAAIAADKSLTEAQRAEKEQAVEEARKAAEAKIDSAADADAVAKAKESGEAAIAGVHTPGDLEALKNAAKADLEKAAQAEKAAIAADKSLTEAQRAEKEQAVEEARKAAEAKIDSAEDADKVAEAKTAGVTAIEGVHTNGDLEALKNAAKADLEKAAAKEQAKAAADKATQAIDAASDQAGVDKAQADGIAAVAAV
ncbi:DUF1542 domain-containing protein, partial [Streptococcus pseudopneumoniae]|uniref:DUF1542 domain-containing protein n=1 Tax=Streptococcus pseudopneumoniae TaxID=257758 RepID=UPI000E71BCC5